MKSLGKGAKSFKDGMNGVEEPEIKEDKEKKE
jgi:Sec-independent protein translocase protein TatA